MAAAPRRPRRRLSSPHRRAEARRAGVRAHQAVRARPDEPAPPPRVRAAHRGRHGRLARTGDVGRVARPRAAAGRSGRSGGPIACSRRWRRCGRWPRSARCRSRKSGTCCAIAWSCSTGSRRSAGTAGCLSARRTRRAAGGSGSCSCPASPSASCRSVRTRIRCCSTSGEAALGGLANQDDRKNAERLLLKLSIGAATERLYLSYPRLDVAETRVRVPSFYALDVVRAITGAVPDHRQLARDAAEEAGASLAWPAPKDPAPRDRRSRARPRVAEAAARVPRSGLGPRPRALPAAAQRVAAPIGDQPLDSRAQGVVAGGRPRSRGAGDQPGAREGASRQPPILAVGAAAVLVVSVPVPARDDLPPRAARRARAARAARSADARQPVSPGAGRVLPGDGKGRCAAGHARPCRGGLEGRRRCARSGGSGIRRAAGAGDPARLAGRDRRAAARSRHLGPEDGRRRLVGAGLLRIQLRPVRRRPRRAQPEGSGHDRRAVRAARIGRSHRAIGKTARRCASPTTRRGRTGRKTG